MYRTRHPPTPAAPPATQPEAARQVTAIRGMEYCLDKDGDVLHRMIGNVTFLDTHNPLRMTEDEELALEMLHCQALPSKDQKMCQPDACRRLSTRPAA